MHGVLKSRDFSPRLALARVVNGVTVKCCKQSATGPWQVGDTHHWSLWTALE